MKLNPKKIVVFGFGYIGCELCKQLNKRYPNAELHIVDKEFKSYFFKCKLKNVKYHVFNIKANLDKIDEVLKKADLCFPLIAVVEAEISEDKRQEIREINYEANLDILRLCLKNNVRVVFPSTTNVYGHDNKLGLTEDYLPTPMFAYAEYKYKIEQDIIKMCEINDARFTIARIATNYGYSEGIRFNLVINLLTKNALLNDDVKIFGCENYRPFIHVKDTAKGLILLAERGPCASIFNLGGENKRIKELGETLKELYPKTKLILQKNVSTPFSYNVCFDKIERLGFKRDWNIKMGIKDLIKRLK